MQRIRIKQYLYMLITCNKQINSVWSLFCALAPAFMCSDLLSNGCMVNMAGDVNAGNYENWMCISYLDIHFKDNWKIYFNWKNKLKKHCLIAVGYEYKIQPVEIRLENKSQFKNIDWGCLVVYKEGRRCWKISEWGYEQTNNASWSGDLQAWKLF